MGTETYRRWGNRGNYLRSSGHDAEPAPRAPCNGPRRHGSREFFWKSTILTGIFVATMAAFLPLRILAELTNIGTLLAFVIVCAAVLIMRYKHPEAERPFKAPLFPLIPILGIISCTLLMFSLPAENWWRLIVWLLIGFAIYFSYARKHSVMARLNAQRK